MIYFDHNATTPVCQPALTAWMQASQEHWYNPASLYREAGLTAHRLEAARERLSELLGCEADRIVFTSGATEANNALFAAVVGADDCHISGIEHPSVTEAAEHWMRGRIKTLPVDENGVVQFESLPTVSALVSVMAANNESGVLQPWREIADHCRARGIPFHTDATQWIGKLDSTMLGNCDYLTGSAHKFGGPKGVGFLVMADEDQALHFLRGGPQENRRRAGTVNYPAIEAMGTALEWAEGLREEAATVQAGLRDSFEADLQKTLLGTRIVNGSAPRLWNTSLLVMPKHDNRKWIGRLSQAGFAVSTGSACSSGTEGSSVVLHALGAAPEELKRTLRVSSGWETSVGDWAALAEAFKRVWAGLEG
jgi:cysteine desulfurase